MTDKGKKLLKYSKEDLIKFILKKDESIIKLKIKKENLIRKLIKLDYSKPYISQIMSGVKK